MKKLSAGIFLSPLRLVLGIAAGLMVLPADADQIKADNNTSLDLGGSWVGGVAPADGDDAIWNSAVITPANCTNTLASAATWGGVVINDPVAPVYIGGNTALTLNNGINLGNATVNLTVDVSPLSLGANQVWNIAAGRTLTTGVSGRSGAVNSPVRLFPFQFRLLK